MALFSTITRWFGGLLGAGGTTTSDYDGEQETRPTTRTFKDTPTYSVDQAMQVSAFWACIELLCETIASMPCFLYETNPATGKRTLAREHPLYRILHRAPNRRHTPYEFIMFLVMNFLMRGNAYARIVRNDRGDVVALWPLASDQMVVKALADNSLVYEYSVDNKVVVYGEESILHWRDKGNGVVGIARLEYMAATLHGAILAQQHANRIYANEGRRAGVLMIDKLLTAEQREQVRANFRGLVEANDDDLFVLEAGAKFEPLAISPADAQLLQSRRFSIEDIARWFGVPSVLINDTSGTTAWGSGIEQIIQGFHKFKLRPLITSFEQAIEARVLRPDEQRRYEVEFSMDALLRASAKDRIEVYARAVQNGLKTRNEVRALENDPPSDAPGADALTVQTNLVPIEMLGKVPTNNGAGGPALTGKPEEQ